MPFRKKENIMPPGFGECLLRFSENGIGTNSASFGYGSMAEVSVLIASSTAALAVTLTVYNDEKQLLKTEMERITGNRGFERYAYSFNTSDICESHGLFFFDITVDSVYGMLYSDSSHKLSSVKGTPWQFTVYNEIYKSPDWLKNGIIYHVFVDRFNKGGTVPKREDAVYYSDWYNDIPQYAVNPGDFLTNNTFFGGTLYGVAEKLDYLVSLGVGTLYLSPVFEAYSNHKYDTGDYLHVDPMFGGDEALELLVKKADEKGIHVVLDGVFNHVGDDSRYFNKYGKYDTLGAYQSRDSEYAEWFTFISFPDEYLSWWGIKNLPRVNKCKSFGDFICNQVIPKYEKMGISGWRLDVVDELDCAFLRRIVSAAKANKEDAAIIGEVWEDASNKSAYSERKHYFEGDALDSVTNYPLRNGIISFMLSGNAGQLKSVAETLYRNYPKRQQKLLMNILGTHDTERIITVLGGESGDGKSNDYLATAKLGTHGYKIAKKRLKMAYALLVTMPGVPCVYYGDEAGVQGYHDPFCRRTYPWGKEDNDILEFYKKLGNLRKNEPALSEGDFVLYNTGDSVFAFERAYGEDIIIVYINLSENDLTLSGCAGYIDLLSNKAITDEVKIHANTARIIKKAAQ